MISTKEGLTTRDLVLLALGSVVGGSFFLGSSIAIRAAGPSIIVAFILGGVLVYIILTALSEMTVAQPVPGSFRTYAEQHFGPGLGFVLGWVYWTGLVLAMSSEATAAAIFLHTWFPELPVGIVSSLIIAAVTLLNLVGPGLFARLESSLAALKLLALVGFVVTGLVLILGLIPARPAVGLGELQREAMLPGGLGGMAGSMLIVMFTYAGFEVLGLAATQARNPLRTIPRAIAYTVISLVVLYLAVISTLLPLIPTGVLTPDRSPLVMALEFHGLRWAGQLFNVIMLSAIISTMLAATFSLGRIAQSLALEGHAPQWLKEPAGPAAVPRRGILFSGAAMLTGVSLSYVLPKGIYLFLVSSGGFSLLLAYAVIMATHYRFRRVWGCPPTGRCQLPSYPYTTLGGLAALLAIIASMPLIPGQGAGLLAGLALTGVYSLGYLVFKVWVPRARKALLTGPSGMRTEASWETGEELSPPLEAGKETSTLDPIQRDRDRQA
ncbi:amino acid permease [Moorellaceae bacterium AZ2]